MTTTTVDLSRPRRVHVVAVGGTAMSAIARLFVQLGHTVSGSDVRESSTLAALRREGVHVAVGHAAANVPHDAAVVVHSTAVRPDNPELVEARALGIPIWRRADARAFLVDRRDRVAVISGTHGKTTTTSMVTTILDRAGMRPSFFIGGTPAGLGTNARYDDGDVQRVEGPSVPDRAVQVARLAERFGHRPGGGERDDDAGDERRAADPEREDDTAGGAAERGGEGGCELADRAQRARAVEAGGCGDEHGSHHDLRHDRSGDDVEPGHAEVP